MHTSNLDWYSNWENLSNQCRAIPTELNRGVILEGNPPISDIAGFGECIEIGKAFTASCSSLIRRQFSVPRGSETLTSDMSDVPLLLSFNI